MLRHFRLSRRAPLIAAAGLALASTAAAERRLPAGGASSFAFAAPTAPGIVSALRLQIERLTDSRPTAVLAPEALVVRARDAATVQGQSAGYLVRLLADPQALQAAAPDLVRLFGEDMAAAVESYQSGLSPTTLALLAETAQRLQEPTPGLIAASLAETFDNSRTRGHPSTEAGGHAPRVLSAPVPAREGSALARLEPNASMRGVAGHYLVDVSPGALSAALTAPSAARLTAAVARSFPRPLGAGGLTHIRVVSSLDAVPSVLESRSGRARRRKGTNAVVDTDSSADFRTVYVPASALNADLSFAEKPDSAAFAPPDDSAPAQLASRFDADRPLPSPIPPRAPIFVGGLISMSAEPPEGFFAAATWAELAEKNWPIATAALAKIWIYRTADSRSRSYFDFDSPAPDRPDDGPREGKFKIAAGLGPAHDPTSEGGAEADLLWLGDEQHGALDSYLRILSGSALKLSDLSRFDGFVQRLSPTQIYVGGVDKAHALTRQGFERLPTDPAIYRRIFAADYDRYLLSLFDAQDLVPARHSYLLATSRGCSQGCAICCSGGLSAFQFFPAERMLAELESILKDARPAPGEKIDVFFVDSNFNNNPARLIQFADLLETSGLRGRFRFFVRHNTVNGFLKPESDGRKAPNLALIDAYARLGIDQVFIGVDSYDDAGTKTLKTQRRLLASQASAARPTYTFEEVRRLVSAFEERGLYVRGFFLTNNPWVSDLDRIDAWYNLLQLWVQNPHFSIDARNRDTLRLKPFDGSPVAEVASRLKLPVISSGRFEAEGSLGEADELMDFWQLSQPRAKIGAAGALEEFRMGIGRVRRRAAAAAADPARPAKDREAATRIVHKLLQRDAELAALLPAAVGPDSASVLSDAAEFAREHASLPAFDAGEQERAFVDASASLVQGLRESAVPRAAPPLEPSRIGGLNFARGYPPELSELGAGRPHTIKDLSGYIRDNMGEYAVSSAQDPSVLFFIIEGDGARSLRMLQEGGWSLDGPLTKAVGFHQIYRGLTPEGRAAIVILRVNGSDRLLHMQSFLRLLGVAAQRVHTLAGFRSWRREYLAAFRSVGSAPDLAVYGMTRAALQALRERFDAPELREEAPSALEADVAGLRLTIADLRDGRTIWFLPDFYGELAGDLAEAVLEHGAQRLLALGTAGSLDPASRVGQWVSPALSVQEDGAADAAAPIRPAPGLERRAVHAHVPTPNLESADWLARASAMGVEYVEVELKHLRRAAAQFPDAAVSAGHVFSDVLRGPNHTDLSETAAHDVPGVAEEIERILVAALGGRPAITSLRARALAEPAADPNAEWAALTAELASAPINDAGYGSESGFLKRFSQAARTRFPRESEFLAAETRMLEALSQERAAGSDSTLFIKNMAVLGEILYQAADAAPASAATRQALAKLRDRYGALWIGISAGRPLEERAPPSRLRYRAAAAFLPGRLGAAARDALSLIEPSALCWAAFPEVIERWTRPQQLAALSRFCDRVAALQESADAGAEPESIWDAALRETQGDADAAAEMLGAVIGQAKAPLRLLQAQSEREKIGAGDALAVFARAARAYYALGRLHETTLSRFGRSALYPRSVALETGKFWHFYAAMAVARRLSSYPSAASRLVAGAVAAGYETATLPTTYSRWRSVGPPFAAAAGALRDAAGDVRTQLRAHDFARALKTAAREAPPVERRRARAAAAYAYAQFAWWQMLWNVGPPTAAVWRDYRDALAKARAAGRRPVARDPLRLFSALRVLGWTGRVDPASGYAADDGAVVAESRTLFEREFDVDDAGREAFGRFLGRAQAYNPSRRRTKLRGTLAYFLREASIRDSASLPGYLDGLLADPRSLMEARAGQAHVLKALQDAVGRTVLAANRGAAREQRVLGVLVFGSYANGAPRPGSDIDMQVITANGAPARHFLEMLEAEWRKNSGPRLDIISFTYLPPIKSLIESLHPDPYLIVSPYPFAVAALERRAGGPQRTPLALERTSPRLGAWTKATVREALRAFLWLSDFFHITSKL